MGVIQVLPQPVINKIAAGEVIERPASVVKELVENSLDAGASSVLVEVEDGGRKLIRVTDNGSGMGADDVALAFASHATSKLKTSDDLFFISTLGFRGEALASIGSVSHARVVSRLRGSAEGAEIEVNGGAPSPPRAKGAPEGTAVEVADLFFNVPARRKFLKSASTEFAHVVDLISRVALADPEVSFKLVHNGREAVNVEGTKDRRRRLADLYGRELADELADVDSGEGPVRVTGFAAPPAFCRANAKMQLTFVNGRFVRDRSVGHAIVSAYEGLLMHGRYPVVFLFLQVDPREVDVNVHPTKIEVRFHQSEVVYRTVWNALKEALTGTGVMPGASSEFKVQSSKSKVAANSELGTRSPELRLGENERRTQDVERRTPNETEEAQRSTFNVQRPTSGRGVEGGTLTLPSPWKGEGGGSNSARGAATGGAASAGAVVPYARERLCFQVQNAYIVEERADGLAIIDQHALHERVLFHEIEERLGKARLESQRLLIPAVVHLSRAETEMVLAERERLAELGIEVSAFGPDAVAINALPVVLGGVNAESVVHDLLATLGDDAAKTPVEERRLAAMKMIACKAAVKAGERLTESEMRSLLEKAARVPERDTCPHGRPCSLFLAFADLEKRFGRG